MKLNQDKCLLLVSGFKYENIWANTGKTEIWESKKQKLLGAETDGSLSFNALMNTLLLYVRKLERNYLFSRDYQISCVQIRKEL